MLGWIPYGLAPTEVIPESLNTDDTGTYQCLVVPSNNNRRKRVAVELVSSIRLKVLRNNQGVPEAEMTRRGYDSWH
ncbi:hypothetical protein PBY51_005712 [Eleginops maclovinus]|uniref:Uncharacterized protein n=1 Tax=Eleginops maclovinus TaxID=56733 RepID=A0AAN7WMW4_ELEMC|nr:hypothetical protein PBY51_005712 [Eleginops maclovinus]